MTSQNDAHRRVHASLTGTGTLGDLTINRMAYWNDKAAWSGSVGISRRSRRGPPGVTPGGRTGSQLPGHCRVLWPTRLRPPDRRSTPSLPTRFDHWNQSRWLVWLRQALDG